MEVVFGADTREIIMTKQRWIGLTENKEWHGLRHPRSGALEHIDNALAAFDQSPSVDNFQTLRQRFNAWLTTKAGRYDAATGQITSLRKGGADLLKSQIDALQRVLQDQGTMKDRIEQSFGGIPWRSKGLCAELYDHKYFHRDDRSLADVLEWESITSSKWAMLVPEDDMDFWEIKGEGEANALRSWPQMTGKLRVILGAELARHGSVHGMTKVEDWPPWGLGVQVRKGLFCHSAAAIAAYHLLNAAAQAEAALSYRIRSIDVVHQQPAVGGGMTHWWVCVNRPDRIVFSNRTVSQFTHVSNLSYLPLFGGFVLDIWGAMWLAQQGNAPQWCTAANPVGQSCVSDAPFISLGGGGDEALKIYVHHLRH